MYKTLQIHSGINYQPQVVEWISSINSMYGFCLCTWSFTRGHIYESPSVVKHICVNCLASRQNKPQVSNEKRAPGCLAIRTTIDSKVPLGRGYVRFSRRLSFSSFCLLGLGYIAVSTIRTNRYMGKSGP